MRFSEFGAGNEKQAVLLHGGGLGPWNYRAVAQLLARQGFYVILPVLDGHAGSDCGFTGVESCARNVEALIRQQMGGRVDLLAGLSLGGQVAAALLDLAPDICTRAVMDGTLVIPMKQTAKWIAPAISCCYGLICRRSFARLQAWSLGIPGEYFEEYFADTAAISREDMIAFLWANAAFSLPERPSETRAQVQILVGQRERRILHKSAGCLQAHFPNSRSMVIKGWHHGEGCLKHPREYAQYLLPDGDFTPL